MDYDDIKAILRDHGVGFGVPRDPVRDYHGPVEHISDEEAIRRDHGVGMGVPRDRLHHYSGPIEHISDEESIRRDHGVGMGVPGDRLHHYSGPIEHISDEESIRRDHGVGIGVPRDPQQKYGTRDQDILNTVNTLRTASWVDDVKGMVGRLPDNSLKEVLQIRLRNTLNKLDDRYGINSNKERIGANIGLDLAIIAESIKEERNIEIDTSLYVGKEDLRDISGLLEKYEEALNECGIEIPIIDGETKEVMVNDQNEPVFATDVVSGLKEEAKEIYGLEAKSESKSK